ncbi:MAG: toxin-activating lysine-acyltransferase [Rhodomicrobiaceae bacterium]
MFVPRDNNAAERQAPPPNRLDADNLMMSFGEAVSVLMRSPAYKHQRLADLEWLLLPPLVHNQIVIASATRKDRRFTIPVGLVLWARLSDEADQHLRQNIGRQPVPLHPREWKSGEKLWIIEALGDPSVVPRMLRQTQETAFNGAAFTLRMVGADGTVTMREVAVLKEDAAAGG